MDPRSSRRSDRSAGCEAASVPGRSGREVRCDRRRLHRDRAPHAHGRDGSCTGLGPFGRATTLTVLPGSVGFRVSIGPAVRDLMPHRRRTSIEPRRVSAQSPKSSSSRRPSRIVPRTCPRRPGTLDGQARFFVSNRILFGSAPSALRISLAPPSPRAVRTISVCSGPGSPIPNRWADLRASLAVGENGSCPSWREPGPTPSRSRTISRRAEWSARNPPRLGERCRPHLRTGRGANAPPRLPRAPCRAPRAAHARSPRALVL